MQGDVQIKLREGFKVQNSCSGWGISKGHTFFPKEPNLTSLPLNFFNINILVFNLHFINI